MAKKKKNDQNALKTFGIVARNRKATFDYSITEKIEAGIILKGAEVKSLRHGRATLVESWAGERDGDLVLFNMYIPEYQGGVLSKFETRATRKLLLHKKEINRLLGAISQKGASLIPLDIHFNKRGIAKVTLGIGIGRKKHDKRRAIADRDWKRDKARTMRDYG